MCQKCDFWAGALDANVCSCMVGRMLPHRPNPIGCSGASRVRRAEVRRRRIGSNTLNSSIPARGGSPRCPLRAIALAEVLARPLELALQSGVVLAPSRAHGLPTAFRSDHPVRGRPYVARVRTRAHRVDQLALLAPVAPDQGLQLTAALRAAVERCVLAEVVRAARGYLGHQLPCPSPSRRCSRSSTTRWRAACACAAVCGPFHSRRFGEYSPRSEPGEDLRRRIADVHVTGDRCAFSSSTTRRSAASACAAVRRPFHASLRRFSGADPTILTSSPRASVWEALSAARVRLRTATDGRGRARAVRSSGTSVLAPAACMSFPTPPLPLPGLPCAPAARLLPEL